MRLWPVAPRLWIPLVFFGVLGVPLGRAMQNAAHVMLGRDQGIYQYAAWALSQGQRDYVDVCDINGPLTHGIHQVLLALGGGDENVFRWWDLAITSVSFALAGACLPGLSRKEGDPAPTLIERMAWGAAAWAALSVQYLSYSYWDIGQRDGFCDWFLLPSLGLQLLAQGNGEGAAKSVSVRRLMLFVAGALSALPWFIKPTFVLFSGVQMAVLGAGLPQGRRRGDLLTFSGGAASGMGLELAWVARVGSLPAMLRQYFWEAPRMYGPIWHVSVTGLLGRTRFPYWCGPAVVMAVLVGLAVRTAWLPRRALLFCLVPLAALAHLLIQGKGFDYHAHPLTAGTVFAACALLCATAERPLERGPPWLRRGTPHLAAVAALALALVQVARLPYLFGRSDVVSGHSFDRPRPALGEHFVDKRYFPWDLGRAAQYVQSTTKPGSRVFLYGTSPYFLFLARRLAASCEMNAHQINADAAIDGRSAAHTYHAGTRLSEARIREVRALRARNAERMFTALKRESPAAAVFTDDEAFLSLPDAWQDFEAQNPEAARWVAAHYREAARFGKARVWLPRL